MILNTTDKFKKIKCVPSEIFTERKWMGKVMVTGVVSAIYKLTT